MTSPSFGIIILRCPDMDESSYPCITCSKRFKRQDVLHRHEKLFCRVNADSRAANSASGSSRAAKACSRCRLHKVKCDGRHPCARCASKTEECCYDGTLTTIHAEPDDSRESHLDHLQPTFSTDSSLMISSASQTHELAPDLVCTDDDIGFQARQHRSTSDAPLISIPNAADEEVFGHSSLTFLGSETDQTLSTASQLHQFCESDSIVVDWNMMSYAQDDNLAHVSPGDLWIPNDPYILSNNEVGP